MPLIKSQQVPTSLAPFSLSSIESHAAAMVRAAKGKAEALLIAAQDEADALKKAAQAQGHAEGRAAGQAEGMEAGKKAGHAQALAEHREKMTAAISALSKAAQEFEASRGQLEALGLRSVIELAAAIARRVTKRQGMLDPAVLTENLQSAIKVVSHWADVRLAVNPKQLDTLKAELPNLRLTWPQLKHVELVPDEKLSPGGCRLTTANGAVDADLDGQLDRVIEHLLPITHT